MVVVGAILAVSTVVLAAALIVLSRRSTRRQNADAAEIARLQEELAAANSRADAAESELTQTQTRLEAAEARVEAAESRAADAETSLEASLEQQQAAAAERDEIDAKLWALELARSERTWRHSVAVLPDAPNPFETATDPLRLAIEIEAAAHHEETGADLSVQWDLSDPQGPDLLLLRTAQEMLARGAHEDTGLTLVVTMDDDGQVSLSMIETEETRARS